MTSGKFIPRGKRDFFEKSKPVCSHIYEIIKSGYSSEKINIHPMCLQIYEDAYRVIWFCNKCTIKYSLPENGAYIYDAGDDIDEKLLNNLEGYEVSTEIGCNPFLNFFKNEQNFSINEITFMSLMNGYTPDPVKNDKRLIRIPFGVEKRE